MSQSATRFLLETRGIQRELDAFVVAACFDRAGATLAFALGDGTVRLVDVADRETWRTVEAHDGAILSLAPDATATGFVSGGDDGKFSRIGSVIADFRSKWVEHVAAHAGEKGKGLLACTVGKTIHLFDQTGEKLKELPHPSSVTGLAFDGKRQAHRGVALQRRLAVVCRGQSRTALAAWNGRAAIPQLRSIPTATRW